MLIRESLNRFELLNEDFLAENILNEKFDINLLKNKRQRIMVLASMFLLFAGGKIPDENLPNKEVIAQEPLIYRLSDEDYLSHQEINSGFNSLLLKFMEEEEKPEVFQVDSNFINSVNEVKPGRLDTAKIEQYNQYDNEIIRGIKTLEEEGESPDADLIKSIMLIETGMNPTKNHLGFEGFPQTKQHIIDYINRKFKKDFTMEDMYDPFRATQFIHYFIKAVAMNDFVEGAEDLIIAYNWGSGNLQKYKKGEKELPQESKDYVSMLNAMQDYWVA